MAKYHRNNQRKCRKLSIKIIINNGRKGIERRKAVKAKAYQSMAKWRKSSKKARKTMKSANGEMK
jgi:hypothetical protein